MANDKYPSNVIWNKNQKFQTTTPFWCFRHDGFFSMGFRRTSVGGWHARSMVGGLFWLIWLGETINILNIFIIISNWGDHRYSVNMLNNPFTAIESIIFCVYSFCGDLLQWDKPFCGMALPDILRIICVDRPFVLVSNWVINHKKKTMMIRLVNMY